MTDNPCDQSITFKFFVFLPNVENAVVIHDIVGSSR